MSVEEQLARSIEERFSKIEKKLNDIHTSVSGVRQLLLEPELLDLLQDKHSVSRERANARAFTKAYQEGKIKL